MKAHRITNQSNNKPIDVNSMHIVMMYENIYYREHYYLRMTGRHNIEIDRLTMEQIAVSEKLSTVPNSLLPVYINEKHVAYTEEIKHNDRPMKVYYFIDGSRHAVHIQPDNYIDS